MVDIPVIARQTEIAGEAARFKQAVDSATADLQRSLQQEHDWAKALETELVNRRRDVDMLLANFDTLLMEHKINEAERLKQAVDSATADLRQSLQQERDRAEALETKMANALRAVEQNTADVAEKPLDWANNNAVVKHVQTAVQPDIVTGTSKSAKTFVSTRVKHGAGRRYGCQRLVPSRLGTNDWLAC